MNAVKYTIHINIVTAIHLRITNSNLPFGEIWNQTEDKVDDTTQASVEYPTFDSIIIEYGQ